MNRYKDLNSDGYVTNPVYVVRFRDYEWGVDRGYSCPRDFLLDMAQKLGKPESWLNEVGDEPWWVEIGPDFRGDPAQIGTVIRHRVGNTMEYGGSLEDVLRGMINVLEKIRDERRGG